MDQSRLPSLVSDLRRRRNFENVRSALTKAGFTEDPVKQILGIPPSHPIGHFLHNNSSETLSDLGPQRTPVGHLIRLFLGGEPIARKNFEKIFARTDLATLYDCGIVEIDHNDIRSRVTLFPFSDLYLVADRLQHEHQANYVFLPDRGLNLFANLIRPTDQCPRVRALDVGTGCGAIALFAAKYYKQVCGIDINPRAVEFARFNALLNGIDASFEHTEYSDFRRSEKKKGHNYDLLTFFFPFLYALPRNFSQSIAHKTSDRILWEIYRDLPHSLSSQGRAIFVHQIKTIPVDYFSDGLRRLKLDRKLRIFLNHSQFGRGVTIGTSVVLPRTLADGKTFITEDRPALTPQLTQDHIERLRYTEQILSGVTDTFMAHRPVPHDHISLVRRVSLRAGRFVEDDFYTIEDLKLSRDMLRILKKCDGRRTVKEIASAFEKAELVVVKFLRRLSERGLLYLRREEASR